MFTPFHRDWCRFIGSPNILMTTYHTGYVIAWPIRWSPSNNVYCNNHTRKPAHTEARKKKVRDSQIPSLLLCRRQVDRNIARIAFNVFNLLNTVFCRRRCRRRCCFYSYCWRRMKFDLVLCRRYVPYKGHILHRIQNHQHHAKLKEEKVNSRAQTI